MLQDSATTKRNYERFIERVIASGEVWGLQHPDGGWAVCPSNEFEDTSVYVFWSDQAYALRHTKGNWSGYIPSTIQLNVFIDSWLKGMSRDGVLVGPNWDANLCGKEVEPHDMAIRLTCC